MNCRSRQRLTVHGRFHQKEDFSMSTFLKSAALALTLAGTALAGTASGETYDNGTGHGRDRSNAPVFTISSPERDAYVYGRARHNTAITIGFGDIAVGYRDGYWDNDHNWHRWRHHRDYRTYRDTDGSHFHDGYHRRYDDNGWQQQH